MWAIINSCALALAKVGNAADAVVDIDFDSPLGVRNLLQRLSGPLGASGCAHECMSYLNAKGAFLIGLVSYGLDLRGANLEHAYFDNCILSNTNFTGANLENSKISSSILFDLDLDRANLDWVTIRDSKIRECSFNEASFDHFKIDLQTAAMSEDVFSALTEKVKIIVDVDPSPEGIEPQSYEVLSSAFPLIKKFSVAQSLDFKDYRFGTS